MGEQVKPTEGVKQPEVRRHDVETTCSDDWCYYDDHLDFVDYHEAALASARAEVEALRKERDALIEALTPSGATKGDYSGEVTCSHECDGEEPHDVSWTSTKSIMELIRKRAAREPGRSGA